VEQGKYRVRFVLGEDVAVYTGLARLLERVRHWRATEVSEDEEPVSAFHAREMAHWHCSCTARGQSRRKRTLQEPDIKDARGGTEGACPGVTPDWRPIHHAPLLRS
jgi:hypothetical protein